MAPIHAHKCVAETRHYIFRGYTIKCFIFVIQDNFGWHSYYPTMQINAKIARHMQEEAYISMAYALKLVHSSEDINWNTVKPDISVSKSQNVNGSQLVLQLSLPVSLKPDV